MSTFIEADTGRRHELRFDWRGYHVRRYGDKDAPRARWSVGVMADGREFICWQDRMIWGRYEPQFVVNEPKQA